MIWVIDLICCSIWILLRHLRPSSKEAASGQTNLFGMLGGDDAASVQSTLHLQKAPVKHDDKERLMWERELLGLYISAHPLDRYETYLSEQTQPLTQLVPEYDSRMMTVGELLAPFVQLSQKRFEDGIRGN